MNPPTAISRRRSFSVDGWITERAWPMNAPIAIAAANPPASEDKSWTEEKATGSTARMLPANSARVARGNENFCA